MIRCTIVNVHLRVQQILLKFHFWNVVANAYNIPKLIYSQLAVEVKKKLVNKIYTFVEFNVVVDVVELSSNH